MKQNFYFKSLLIALFVLFGGGVIHAAEETIYTENFGTASTELILTTYNKNWTIVRGGYVKVQSNTRYGNSGRALQMGSKNSPGAEVITPTFSETLSGDITFKFYLSTNNSSNESVTLSVEGAGTIIECSGATSILSENKVNVTFKSDNHWYEVVLKLTGCKPETRIRIKNLKTLFVDNITVVGEADPRTAVKLEYSESSFKTPTESGVIADAPTLTVNPEAALSEVTYSSSDEGVATVDVNGQVTAVSSGQTTIKASIKDSKTYRDAESSYILTVGLASSNLRYNPKSVNVTYDKKETFTAPTLTYANGYDGTITYISSNPSVAEVDENGVVTILAVGETTITANGAATPYLKASEASFTLSVNDIQGSDVGGGTGGSVFVETFDKADSDGGNDGDFSKAASAKMNNDNTCDNFGWSGVMYKADKCVKTGTGSATGQITTPSIAVEPNVPYTLNFKAAPWASESTTKMKVTVTGGSIEGISTDNMTAGKWNEFFATITPTSNTIKITFSVTGKERFFIDEINVTAPASDEKVEVTIPASGWGTYCCQWPLDFTAAPEGLKAYAVSATSATNVTLSEITQKLIGGTGIIINGTPGTKYTIKVADKGTAYEGTNMLTGTLAPTYVEEGQYFLKSGKFVYSSAGTLPENKAYLKSDGTGTQDAKLSFLFDTTSIEQFKTEASDDAWYDLSGRKVNPSSNVKGVYIHNGKKVVK